ncbi:hemagglutinin repeat-containing protein [Herbaspirillum robiniae]|uniref:hemagglutinin repeat-containing protein n=1 Tax=Herbaspirillum robiniae TaxID=2014887 RepID=UPI0013FE2F9B|nr:hemagglutinin repeat-containing protein [Herbaspirillum robiniae]
MNRLRYKVVFNRRRGEPMAVAENASTPGAARSSPCAATGGTSLPALRFCLLAVVMATAFQTVAHAQIYSDRNAPRSQQPTVLSSGNGVPVVNIQTPNTAGVSVNSYRQFDVGANGAILNNARAATQTQLGGYVQANPWLATGAARVIVNQVNSANPSYLRGYVEVAGQRAQVVIANAAGITCSGCGFINANRITLTTGTPVIAGGSLEAYRVAGGVVTVDGAGLDASGADYADIIARAVRINAGVWAQDLKVSAGLNTVNADHSQVVAGVAPSDAAPGVAIDVAQLGGMYARHIYLASTEHGVGVRNAGTVGAAAGDAVLTAEGRLENSGSIGATGTLTVRATDTVQNTGTMGADSDVAIKAGTLENRGTLSSSQASLNVTTDALVTNRGRIEAARALALSSSGLDNAGASISATDVSIDTRARTIGNAQGSIVAQNALIVSGGSLNNDGGLLQALGSVSIDANGQAISNINSGSARGILSQGALTMKAGALINRNGYVSAAGDLGLTATSVDNDAGVIGSTASAGVNASRLSNSGGTLQARTALDINVAGGTADNSNGVLRSDGAVTVQAATLRNDSTQGQGLGIEGASVAITAQDVSNRQGAMRTDTSLALNSGGSVDNTSGLLSSAGTVAVSDAQAVKTLAVSNEGGTLIAGRQVSMTAATLSGNGKVVSQQDLAIDLSGSVTNTGQIAATGDATVNVGGTFANAGKLAAGGTLALTAATVDNQANGSLVANTLKLKATDVHTFINRGLIDGANTVIESSTVNNIGTGRIYGDNVAIGADVLNNTAETVNGVTTAAVIAARNRLDIGAGVINNSEHALIYSAGDMAIGGALDASKKATGMAGELNNSSATVNADGNLSIAAATINNTNAHLQTTDQTGPGNRIVTYRLNGSSNLIDGNSARLVNLGSGQVVGPTNWRDMGDEDNFRLVLPSSDYPVERYGPPFDYSRGMKYGDNAIAPAYVPGWMDGTPGSEQGVTFYPEIINYGVGDRIWAVMGVTPPQDPGPSPGGEPQPTQMCWESCNTITPDPAVYAAWQAAYAVWKPKQDAFIAALQVLNGRIDAFNNNVRGRSAREWTIYDGTEQITRTVVTRSDPGMITSGGNMNLNAGAVNNYASQIIAGGTVAGNSVNGTAINNTGPLGVQSVTSSGSASYTYIKSHAFSADDRRYDDAPYQSQTIVTNFQLDITPTNGAAPSRSSSVRAVATPVSGASGQAAPAMSMRTANLNLSLPNNALYRINTTPGNSPLVETDPQFANYRSWLSSDFMLNQLQSTPDSTVKKLGDGFYEQQLVQQQIQQAIGQRYLAGYSNNEAQYMALMNAGVQQAQAFNYTVGVALTDAQIAQLTSDIVWMVKQTVTLADGSTQEVLVPQVYLRSTSVQVTGQGTLIAGNNVAFQTAQDIVNSGGTIAARQNVSLAADNIQNLGGRISGANTVLSAATDINNLGGAIDGSDAVVLAANRDININSTRVETANAVTTGANISQVASVTGKNLTIAAGRDLVANAAVIGATGDAALSAGRDVNLGTVNQGYRQEINWARDSGASNWVGALTGPNFVDESNGAHGTRESGVNRATLTASQDVGTQVNGNNVNITAGRDLNAQGTQVVAQAALAATAGRDLNIGTANESASARDQHQHSSSGILSGSTTQTDDASSYSNQIGSTFSGNTTVLAAGRNANITGSDVVSTQGTQVTAGNDINIIAATDASSESHYRKETTSGVFSGGGLGVTVGSKMQSSNYTRNSTTASAATVGATDGNVTLVAGNQYNQVGSDVLAPRGDIDIAAKAVNIVAAAEAVKTVTEEKYKMSGVTVAVTSPIISALQTVQQMGEAAGKTKDGRMKALAAATAGMSLYDAAQGAQAAAANPKSAGFGLSITAGGSENGSTTEQNSVMQKGSTVGSGGNTSIRATGDGVNSNITIQGSDITAGGNLALKADNDINLLAAQNVDEQHSSRSSSSYGVGLAIQFGQGGAAFGFTANAAGSRGNSDGKDVANTLTHLKAGGQASLDSGRDTNLTGATVEGNQVVANVGRDLNIASVQDTSTFASKDQNLGGSMTIGAGFSGSVSAGQSKVNADYASVGEQSGISAGDGGFQVNVKGNTDLKGAKIASTDKAVEDGKNSLTTGTLTVSEIENRSQYKAESQSVSAGGGNWADPSQGKPGGGFGIGSTSGDERSTTRSGVSGGAVTITDANAQQEKAGQTSDQTIASLDQGVRTGKDSSNSLSKNWNGDELRQDVEAQAKITQAFGQQAAKAIGDYAETKKKEFQEAAKKAALDGDQASADNLTAEAAKWADGGVYRVAAHTAIGALAGGVGGALGAAASASLMPDIAIKIKKMELPDAVESAISLAAAAGLGAVVGSSAGAASAFNVDLNNRQLHPDETAALLQLQKGKTLEEKARLADAVCAMTHCSAGLSDDNPNKAALVESEMRGAQNFDEQRKLRQTGLFSYGDSDAWKDLSDRAIDFTKEQLGSAGRGALNLAALILRNGPNALPSDLPGGDAGDFGGPSGTAGAVITPSIPICIPGFGCVLSPSITIPSNVYASTGNGNQGSQAGESEAKSSSLDAQEVRTLVRGTGTPFENKGNAFNVSSEEELISLFSKIVVGAKDVAARGYDGTMKVLADGTRVGLRNESTTGGKTIDVFPARGKDYKVHIGN